MCERFTRTEALFGAEAMSLFADAHVLIVGVGGVGGWCAEALARSGIGRLTLVDDDIVQASNLNRQCAATMGTLGRMKVEAMAERIGAVNPDCVVRMVNGRYPDVALDLTDYDVVVDAIDSVDAKATLLAQSVASGVRVVSSMGAALRIDATRVTVTRLEKVTGDGLARAVRQRLKRTGAWTEVGHAVRAVWSDERPLAREARGSVMSVIATFGMCLAMEVMRYVGRMQS